MTVKKITEELDFLQKKVAAVREIYDLYPDTTINSKVTISDVQVDLYSSQSVNKDVNIIRFRSDYAGGGLWYNAYPSKLIGCIELCSSPNRFALFSYTPKYVEKNNTLSLIIQNYSDNMARHHIPDSLIRECDLYVVAFVKEHKIDLTKTNLRSISNDSTVTKLLSLL